MGKLSINEVSDQIQEDEQIALDNQVNELYENYSSKPNDISFKVEDPWKEYDKKIAKEKEDEKRIWMKEYNKFLKDEEPKDFPHSIHLDDINDRVINLPKSRAYKDLLKEYLSNYRENLSFSKLMANSDTWVLEVSRFLKIPKKELYDKIEISKPFQILLDAPVEGDGAQYRSFLRLTRKEITNTLRENYDYDVFFVTKEEKKEFTLPGVFSFGQALYTYHGINFKKE